MTRYIDADALKKSIEELKRSPWFNSVLNPAWHAGIKEALKVVELLCIDKAPTIEAVPTEFIMENCNLEFVCDELTGDGEWCSEHCQYSEPQPECIHRYIDKIWRKEHDKAD